MLVPIYQYHANLGSGNVYYYTPQSPQSVRQPWISDGVAFYGCEAGDSGAVPVYMYIYGSEDSGQLWYSTNPKAGDANWKINVTGPVFYTLSPRDKRGQAVVEWLAETPHTHYYGGSSSLWLTPPSGGSWEADPSGEIYFYAVPAKFALRYSLQSVTYDNSTATIIPQPLYLGTQEIKNDSYTDTSDYAVLISKSVTNQYSLTLTDTLTVGASLEIDAGIPDVADAKGTVSMSIALSESDSWTSSTDESVSITGSVTAPPRTDAILTLTVFMAQNVSVPCSVVATATSPGMSADDLTAVFTGQNPALGDNVQTVDSQTIRIDLDGTFKGSWRTDALSVLTDKATKKPYAGSMTAPKPVVAPKAKPLAA
jgi:hypothetical protein